MRRFPSHFLLYTDGIDMAYQRVPRPSNTIPDAIAWKALGLSRASFFRKLKSGALTSPVVRDGTVRRWWTPADLEAARQELAPSQEDFST